MSEALPLVSFVIPMRNESGHIAHCLDSILAQDYPRDRREVIVVDGNSDDASPRILAGYGDQIRILSNPKRIVPTAMNVGIRAARGEIIARVDAHTVLEKDYLRVGVELLRQTGAGNVGGPMRSVGGGPMGDAIALAMASRFGIGAYFHFATEEREVDTVYMGMWPRSIFERIGLFDEELVRNQDDELSYRLRKAGSRILVTPRMRSHYQNRQSLKTLWRQFFQYGLWKVRVLQKHPKQMSVRHFVPPLFVAGLIGSALSAPFVAAGRWLFVGLLSAYGFAVSAATIQAVRHSGWRHFARVWIVFAAMHVGWGGGFLLGLLRFGRRWVGEEPNPPRLTETSVPTQ